MNQVQSRIDTSAFREYDIRALVGTEMPIESVYELTRAIIAHFLTLNPKIKSIVVGMDGRTHSPAIAKQVCTACIDSGIDVYFIGTCPTPTLYFGLHTLNVQAGIMITASHNPKEYNGLKLCVGTECIWGNHVRAIRDLYQAGVPHICTQQRGTMFQEALVPTYVAWLANHFAHLRGMRCSAIVDCGNGTAGVIWPSLVQALELKDIHLLYPEVDGAFPHHEADPTVAANMRDLKKILATSHYQMGLGFDGDCDRMAPMTKAGEIVPGDKMIALFSKQIVKTQPNVCVVCDIKSSASIVKMLNAWGVRAIMTRTGHAIIKHAMHTEKAVLGGELSCHFTFKDRYFGFDDGFYAALRVLELLNQNGTTLEQELAIFPPSYASPEIRIACPEALAKQIISEVQAHLAALPQYQLNTLDGIRLTTAHGWGIMRPSNTQPVLSLRFESETATGLEQMRTEFATLLKPYFEQHLLEKELGA